MRLICAPRWAIQFWSWLAPGVNTGITKPLASKHGLARGVGQVVRVEDEARRRLRVAARARGAVVLEAELDVVFAEAARGQEVREGAGDLAVVAVLGVGRVEIGRVVVGEHALGDVGRVDDVGARPAVVARTRSASARTGPPRRGCCAARRCSSTTSRSCGCRPVYAVVLGLDREAEGLPEGGLADLGVGGGHGVVRVDGAGELDLAALLVAQLVEGKAALGKAELRCLLFSLRPAPKNQRRSFTIGAAQGGLVEPVESCPAAPMPCSVLDAASRRARTGS